MSEMRPLHAAARSEFAPHAIAHPRPFLAELVVGPEHLSRLLPHANNAEYVRWLDRVAELHAESAGYGRTALLTDGRAWFVARHEVDYLAECWESERLVIATWVRTMRRTTSWRDTLIVRPCDATLVCRASTLWAYVDLASRRPTRVPTEMSRGFDVLESAPDPA
ncbi:MAG: acyl-CoA thioesterase [Phycisphaerales bacterium]